MLEVILIFRISGKLPNGPDFEGDFHNNFESLMIFKAEDYLLTMALASIKLSFQENTVVIDAIAMP